MDEYIGRKALLKKFAGAEDQDNEAVGIGEFLFAVIRGVIENQPAADVVEVRHGCWISYLDGDHIMPEIYYQCSECGRRGYTRKHPYCNCGAKMDGKGDV